MSPSIKNGLNRKNIIYDRIMPLLNPDLAEKLSTIVTDFTNDLSNTFPEYAFLWSSIQVDQSLYQYFCSVYPERFFDILYQNEDIFLPSSEYNTFFLPNVEFKLLYGCEGITETTKQAIWKYLQLILLTLTSSFQHKSSFGESANLFDGIDEDELQHKISEAISGIGEFFGGGSGNKDETPEEPEKSEKTMPNPDDIFGNLKSLFDGKIGALAKELAEEMSDEFKELFTGSESEPDPKKIMKEMRRN
jgi:hypothetical protein